MPVPFNVYEFFRFIIPGGYFVALFYVLLALLLNIPISFDILSYQTIGYFFASLVVSIVIDSRDVLQYGSGWLREADYFQRQFPSRYLLDRCTKCKTKSSCSKPLVEANYLSTWFYFFNEYVPSYARSIVLTTSYLCRVVFYTHLFSLLFFYVGLSYPLISYFKEGFSFLTFIYSGILLIVLEVVFFSNNVRKKGERRYLLFFRALNPTRLFVTIGLILGFFNPKKTKEDEVEAKGFWLRWKGHNKTQIRWMEINEPLLTEKICHQAQVNSSGYNKE